MIHCLKYPKNLSIYIGHDHTFDGNGHSSRRSVMTAGPKGSPRGTTWTIDLTTTSHPDSLSAMECSLSMDTGGSWSLETINITIKWICNNNFNIWLIIYPKYSPLSILIVGSSINKVSGDTYLSTRVRITANVSKTYISVTVARDRSHFCINRWVAPSPAP